MCEKGYLNSAETGNGLFYAGEPGTCSVWQFQDGAFLYNPGAVSTYNGRTYRNYCLEWYNGYYTTYGRSASSDQTAFRLRFYRLGDSDPDDPIVTDALYRLPVFETSDTHGYLADTSAAPYRYLLAYISDKVADVRGRGADARSDVTDWAEDAMRWAVGVGLLRGDGARLNPKAEATRAEAAALLRRRTELRGCG